MSRNFKVSSHLGREAMMSRLGLEAMMSRLGLGPRSSSVGCIKVLYGDS